MNLQEFGIFLLVYFWLDNSLAGTRFKIILKIIILKKSINRFKTEIDAMIEPNLFAHWILNFFQRRAQFRTSLEKKKSI